MRTDSGRKTFIACFKMRPALSGLVSPNTSGARKASGHLYRAITSVAAIKQMRRRKQKTPYEKAQMANRLFALYFFPTVFRKIHYRKMVSFAESSRFFLSFFGGNIVCPRKI